MIPAPTIQWDFRRPFLLNPSESTINSVTGEGEEIETETEGGCKIKTEENASLISLNSCFASECAAIQARARNAASPCSVSPYSSTLSLLASESSSGDGSASASASASGWHHSTLNTASDANLRPPPRRLSPVSETSSYESILRPRARSSSNNNKTAAARATPQRGLTRSAHVKQVKSGDLSSAAAAAAAASKDKEKDKTRPPSSAASSIPYLRTASALPVTRVTHADVVRSSVALPQATTPLSRNVGTPSLSEFAPLHRCRAQDVQQEEIEEAEYRWVVELVRKREKASASFKGRVKRVVRKAGKVEALCCNVQ